jgi:hypothetical protein
MKNVSPISIVTFVFALLAFGLFVAGPAYCQEGGVALLLQQTPSQGGMVTPDIGVHHYDAGTKVTLVAVPRSGYYFVYWLGDVLDPTASKTTAFLSEPKVIVAVFQQVEDDQMVVGQNATLREPGIGDSSPSYSISGGGGGGGTPPGDDPDTPTEESDPPPDDPPDDPLDPPDDPPIDPPDPPVDPPIDPPDVPEPATGLLLTLGGLALLKKRWAS